MPYFINNLNQKIAFKYIKGKSPGIIFIHGLNSDMNGEKALTIQKYAQKNNWKKHRKMCRTDKESTGTK